MSTSTNANIYDRITGNIVTALERGVAPWVRPWAVSLPYNVVSGREYRGTNLLSCLAAQLATATLVQRTSHSNRRRRSANRSRWSAAKCVKMSFSSRGQGQPHQATTTWYSHGRLASHRRPSAPTYPRGSGENEPALCASLSVAHAERLPPHFHLPSTPAACALLLQRRHPSVARGTRAYSERLVLSV
jgi:hypothetical protein